MVGLISGWRGNSTEIGKMSNRAPSPMTRFGAARGNLRNPGGKPLGARNRLTARFLEALADDFELHGPAAIAAMRQTNPAAYVRMVGELCSKEMEI
ncbi:MAG: hypothetical protein EXQ87_12865 [Alphaproteobacteria bacterium]|nr:hypothetical protein [Alphaproteobacteria bacterium]